MDILNLLKNNMNHYLKKKGWTKSELASRTPLSTSTLSDWFQEDGVQPSLRNLVEVCKALEISMSELFSENDFEKLEAKEDELISCFCNLSESEQDVLLALVRVMSKKG